MSFKRISENYFLIDADGEKLSMNIERFLWHHCAFTLGRETENLKNVNLFKVFNDMKNIVVLYTKEKPEIHDVFLQFNPNLRIDRDRWINLCEYYISKKHDDIEVKVNRLSNIGLIFRIIK
jgi:hypothetical protein